ncbi:MULTISPECIES: NDR1/HIN1-like protein [Chitinophaga]|uniref:NDR1/HIN1-like protein n=1 Tax=Chitinophaga TaxID=79328 RepID=UPI000DB93D47|nr:LEA type 2 family protein [Chitinophaga ginsengisegetis]MDR6569119.1 LEA14-like dessication related protein [Chitinophaga ginsengisegetis]MDR6648852.1 LEA14-like dessication related protein [Chitinophaga ginsengisegetis]MDR6655200.1 LEA14-like dessication related protein [Chitinophaga ginsengisegetis]
MTVTQKLQLLLTFIMGIFLSGCTVFQTPEPRLPKKLAVRIFNITPQRAALKIEGIYYNPNNFGFTFKSGDLELMLDTFLLGKVHIDTVINVPAHALFTVPVTVAPDFNKLGQTGINLEDSVHISFKGTMKGSVGWFSKTIHIAYDGRHYLDLQMN